MCASDAVEELITYRLANDGGTSINNLNDRRCRRRSRRVRIQPIWVAAAGASASDVIHILHHRGEARERATRGPAERRSQVMRDEGGMGPKYCHQSAVEGKVTNGTIYPQNAYEGITNDLERDTSSFRARAGFFASFRVRHREVLLLIKAVSL
jgi:hypothetical protein